jgi:hypothetical protein
MGADRAARVAGQLKSGAEILIGWLGRGLRPVASGESQYRADICTGRTSGRPCPFNRDGFKFIASAARIIHRQVEYKNHLRLRVEGEENLKTCAICLCHLPLKVHVPLQEILNHTDPEKLAEFSAKQPECWMLNLNFNE